MTRGLRDGSVSVPTAMWVPHAGGFSLLVRGKRIALPARGSDPVPVCGVTVRDVEFVLLTLVVFVLLGLAAKGASRL